MSLYMRSFGGFKALGKEVYGIGVYDLGLRFGVSVRASGSGPGFIGKETYVQDQGSSSSFIKRTEFKLRYLNSFSSLVDTLGFKCLRITYARRC